MIISKSIAIGLLGLGAILFAILLAGCSDEQSPTPPARTVPRPTITAQPGVTLVPTPPPSTALTDSEEIDEIPVGGSVDGRLDEPGETDRFLFLADERTAYLTEAVWDTLPSIRVDIYDAYIRDGFPTFGKVKEASREPFRLVWTAPESGKYNLDVSSGDDLGSGTGTYTVFVSIDIGPLAGPTNVRYAPEGTAVRVSRIPVEGADYYNIYHDELFAFGCRLAGDGIPSLCEELATNVVEITYVHDNPGNDTNYYWVVACRPRECSKIDSVNPPIALETSSTGPTNTATPTEIQTPTPSNTPLPVLLPAIPTRLGGRQPK